MQEKEFDYINVIPLVDIMLVLLTIVLTTSTFIATGAIPVELPRASKGNESALKTTTIEVDKAGVIYVDAAPTTLGALKGRITAISREAPVLIRADKDIRLQVFVSVLDVIKQMGFKQVSLQTKGEG
ncbi:MAG: biopolymer transporter ExbD [Nitrospirae bacterium]|nr:biopolymer transporter ExbD [Nitrospirota bacterium]